MQVYELITCVRRANENAGNLISVVQFLINLFINRLGSSRCIYEVLSPCAGKIVGCKTVISLLLHNLRNKQTELKSSQG